MNPTRVETTHQTSILQQLNDKLRLLQITRRRPLRATKIKTTAAAWFVFFFLRFLDRRHWAFEDSPTQSPIVEANGVVLPNRHLEFEGEITPDFSSLRRDHRRTHGACLFGFLPAAIDFPSTAQRPLVPPPTTRVGGADETAPSKTLGLKRKARQPLKGAPAAIRRAIASSSGPRAEHKVVQAEESTEGATMSLEEMTEALKGNQQLEGIDGALIETVCATITRTKNVSWEDVIGLQQQKEAIRRNVVLPLRRPDLFTGLRRPARGILLFGPPGTGKTMIGRAMAAEAGATFFSLSASNLTSKWFGEGEKLVRALFAVARARQPSIIFIDEIDSLLTARSSNENESSRRMKTEFLVQLDGVSGSQDDRIVLVGATNRPQELDDAAKRRLSRRIYIPLPTPDDRLAHLRHMLCGERHTLSENQIVEIAQRAKGFSGADLAEFAREAAQGPVRDIGTDENKFMDVPELRPLEYYDFESALRMVKPTVAPEDLAEYIKYDREFGFGASGPKPKGNQESQMDVSNG